MSSMYTNDKRTNQVGEYMHGGLRFML